MGLGDLLSGVVSRATDMILYVVYKMLQPFWLKLWPPLQVSVRFCQVSQQ
jgi:hypothetical protein